MKLLTIVCFNGVSTYKVSLNLDMILCEHGCTMINMNIPFVS